LVAGGAVDGIHRCSRVVDSLSIIKFNSGQINPRYALVGEGDIIISNLIIKFWTDMKPFVEMAHKTGVKKLLVMSVDKVQAIGQMHIFSKISVFHE